MAVRRRAGSSHSADTAQAGAYLYLEGWSVGQTSPSILCHAGYVTDNNGQALLKLSIIDIIGVTDTEDEFSRITPRDLEYR